MSRGCPPDLVLTGRQHETTTAFRAAFHRLQEAISQAPAQDQAPPRRVRISGRGATLFDRHPPPTGSLVRSAGYGDRRQLGQPGWRIGQEVCYHHPGQEVPMSFASAASAPAARLAVVLMAEIIDGIDFEGRNSRRRVLALDPRPAVNV